MDNMMNSLADDYSFIKQIQFANYSPEQIKKISVVNITKAQLYNSNGEPSPNGLFDPKMGYIEPRKRCRTCFKTLADCPGHIGHIELARPVFNIQYEAETMKIMKCFCPKCNKLLINPNHHWVKNLVSTTKNKRRERFEKISKFISTKIKQCGGSSDKDDDIFNPEGCGAIQPSKYHNKLKSDSVIILEWKVEGETNEVVSQSLNAEMVLAIFKRISEDDANVLGFNKEWCHPSSLIISVLPVVPPCVRPSVKQYNSQRSEDDLTHKYNDIIKANETLKDKLSSDNSISPEYIKNYTDLLQYHITTLFNNNITGINPSKTRSGRPMKTLAERLKGKQGRIRHNLMGKRVDFSARSVISPDANIKIGELGVPLKVAMNLTFPEVVNKYNINQMYKLVRNGNTVYPGAKSIKSVKDKKTRLLEYRDTNSIVLEFGDIINRHLLNGDTVLFNRQPSLHKMSMMAHKVRVIHEGNTFRLNIDVCTPYNADFDGDEMNMHVPQSYQTAIELDMIAAVPKHILSPSNMAPIIKPSQDNLLGIYKMTDNGVEFTHQEVMNMLIGVQKFTGVLPEPEIRNGSYIRWTGRQLFSLILPPINIYKNNEDEPTKDNVLIENGILKQGQVDKSISGKIVHMIFNEYGYKEAERYLNDLQCITTRYMIRSGYSVGISDLVIHPDLKKRFQEEILKGKQQVIDVTKKTHLNILEDVNEGLDQIYESTVRKITSDIVSGISKKGKNSISKYNRIKFMVDSGSKGSSMNIQQMVFLLGEQSIDNQRVPLGFPDRSLPHFPRYENGIESRGFVANNFIDGLTPQELFFHAMAGREGLIDTAVKTANSGYLQRKLIKATEDLKVNHDYTVRSSNNDIVEFVYGSDGFYPSYLERQSTKLINLDNDRLMNNYIIDENEKFELYVVKKEVSKMKKSSDFKNKIKQYNQDVMNCIDILYNKYALYYQKINNLVLYYPIDIAKKVDTVVRVFNLTSAPKSDISPLYVIEGIYEILDHCSVNNIDNNTLRILLVDNLSPKRLLRDLHFNKIAFDFLKNAIMARFDDVLVEGGEMVGPLASQSIGEKSTQLTLNTFHSAGVGEKSNVTRGVPRLHELLSNTKNPKNPTCNVYLEREYGDDIEMASKIGNNIECTMIGDLLLSDAIYLDKSNHLDNVLPEDKDIMRIYEVFSKLSGDKTDIENNMWIIRLEFDRKKIIESKVSMSDIQIVLNNEYPDSVLMYMDDNASKLIFRIKLSFSNNPLNMEDDVTYLKDKIEDIKNVMIKGVNNINKVYYLAKDKNIYYEKVGNLYEEKQEIVINTDGSNLFDILMTDGVDKERTYSIDPNEMNSIFGIEAARYMIENQITDVLEGSHAMTSPRHVSLLCNKMTNGGNIMSVDRHGINKENIGPLAKSSFEETTDQLLVASLFGDTDDIKGVSANIMVGQIPSCGTGDSKIILDEEMLITQEAMLDDEDEVDFNSYFESSKYCEENDQLRFNINAIKEEDIEIDDLPDIMVE
jgi:DNA-directed RNA polymerase II subunit RPB1